MIYFLYSFSHVLTKAILQSVIGSAVIWSALLILLRVVRKAPSVIKYRLCLAALLVAFACFLLPFGDLQVHESTVLIQNSPHKAPINFSLSHFIATAATLQAEHIQQKASTYSNVILMLYALGVLWFALKLIIAFLQSQRLKKQLLPADESWLQSLKKCRETLGLNRNIMIGFSEKISSPCVIGYIKATILIPVGLTTSLSPLQVEAILLHELAHLRHLDYYLNILIRCIGCLMFFNPFIWLISRRINLYRELACDELAAQHGDHISLAESLLQIARFRNNIPATTIGLAAHKHSLSFRIQNLLNMNNPKTATGTRLSPGITATLFTLALLLLTGSRSLSQNKETLKERLSDVSQKMYTEGNTGFVLVDALNDGLIQERQPYSVIFTANNFVINGKTLTDSMKKKYVARYQEFLASRGHTGCGYGSFSGDGLKLEEIFDKKSKFRQKPAPAQMVMPTGKSFSEQVVQAMVADGLLDSARADYVIEYKKDGVFLNSKKLEGETGKKYWQLFADGEGYVPRTEKDGVRIENHPDKTPHIYIDANGHQRLEYEDKIKPEQKNEPDKQDR